MKIMIFDKQVLQNIERFKHLIHRAGELQGKAVAQTAKRGYKAYINILTGELKFNEPKKLFPLSKWKGIIIQLHPTEEGAFEVLSSDGNNIFDCSELSPTAYAKLANTAKILNELSYDPKHVRDTFWILAQLAALDFDVNEEEEGVRNFIHSCWYEVDRPEAEELLKDADVGTYLFRKDEFAKDLEDSLDESLDIPINCITVTYKEKDGKIAEKTIVYRDGKWLFYDDDPNLSGRGYESVKELLATSSKKLKFPLLIESR